MAELAAKPARIFVVWEPVLFTDWSSPSTSACGYRKFKISRNGGAPPAIVTEIVAEMITLGLGSLREQALSWKAGAVLTENPSASYIACKSSMDSSELAFLIRQIDEYVQVMEVLIRKTPALDTGELALARNLRKKLLVGKQAGRGRKSVTKESG